MKKFLKYSLYLGFALVIHQELFGNLTFSPKFPTIIYVSLVLAIFELILKPVLKILLLPVTVLTLGLVRIIIQTLGLYLAVYLISGFEVSSLTVFNYFLSGFWAYLFTSFFISTLLYIFRKL